MEPLANRIRPLALDKYFGQEHLVGEDGPIRKAILEKHIFSFILWGPPGTGKTTLAKIYAKSVGAEMFTLSAVSAGKDQVRQILDLPTFLGKTKILFLDEIHRFNKAQQDFLLPFVESGQIYLIGATTENPSFEVIPALLSRCRVFTLKQLGTESLRGIILSTGIPIEEEAINLLVGQSGGDARQAIGILENVGKLYSEVTLENLKRSLQSSILRYDKKGEEHYNIISAFIKSMRASQVDAALYYLNRMIEAAEDPLFIARRMVVFASEDIGMADPGALGVANAVFQACSIIGYPECGINLAEGVVYLSLSPKSRKVYDSYLRAKEDVQNLGNLEVPFELRNAPTKFMKDIGYGSGYEMYSDKDYLPEKLRGRKYYTI